ncbi:MAG: MATE family efflux transporter [Pseudomonadota bacterium]|nr:MATE family efflux transporter [Pseudomonadota bacterium]
MKFEIKKPRLKEDPVGESIISLMIPMCIGMIALVSYSLVDTYFIGKIGTMELAAVAFTFPVAFIVNAISIGLSTGVSSVASRLFGSGEREEIQRITTHAAILAVLCGLFVLTIGLSTIRPVFTLLGANEVTLPLIEQYMSIYYFGGVFLIVPMIGNSVLRSSGDAKTPSMLMTAGALANIILDPILIFGFGPIPAMGLEGAAYATVLANFLVGGASFAIIYYREKLFRWNTKDLEKIWDSWKRIFHVGLPSMASSLVAPFTTAFITWQISAFGQESVAGFGIASRIEGISMMIVMALSAAMTPFVGQNYGAKLYDRVAEGMRYSYRLSMIYGLCVALVLTLSARLIAHLFTNSPEAIATSTMHLSLVPWSYGFLGISMVCISGFNASGKPGPAMIISMSRTILVYAPLAFLMAMLMGLRGIFLAAFIANILAGTIGFIWFRSAFKEYSQSSKQALKAA